MHRTAASLVLAVLITTAGFVGAATTQETLREEASPATVEESALDETGYELDREYERTVSRTVDDSGERREVEAVNEVTEYRRTLSLGPLGEREAGLFATVSTPAVEADGRALNPVAEMDDAELLEWIQEEYDRLSVDEAVDSRTVETLDEEMNVTKFEGTAVVGGQEVDVFLHVGKVRHGDDYVVVVGVYPKVLGGEERVVAMIEALEHEA
jgi:hypothetical protein